MTEVHRRVDPRCDLQLRTPGAIWFPRRPVQACPRHRDRSRPSPWPTISPSAATPSPVHVHEPDDETFFILTRSWGTDLV